MSFHLPAALPGATTAREAVEDALYRAVQSIDCADEALLRSALADDVEMQMARGGVVRMAGRGLADFKRLVFDRAGPGIDTTHHLSNVRVSVAGGEGATAARATCLALAQHCRLGRGHDPGPHRYVSGAMYSCDLVKDGDLWKLKRWHANITWSEGDEEVTKGEQTHL